MANWISPPYYAPPPSGAEYYMDGAFVAVRFSIEYGMGLAILGDLADPNNKFNNNPALDAMYHDPIAYATNLVAYAETLAGNKKYYAPAGWDAVEAGLQYANIVFALLKQIPCNRGDEASNNLFDSWAAGTGQMPSGTAPIVAAAGGDASTGQSAVSPEGGPSIL